MTTPIRAIRAKCVECAGGKVAATACSKEECSLHPYRTGHYPARMGCGPRLTPESAKKLRAGHGDAISASGITTQDVKVSANSARAQGGTPETLLGHSRAPGVQVDGSRRLASEIIAEAILAGLSPRGDS